MTGSAIRLMESRDGRHVYLRTTCQIHRHKNILPPKGGFGGEVVPDRGFVRGWRIYFEGPKRGSFFIPLLGAIWEAKMDPFWLQN